MMNNKPLCLHDEPFESEEDARLWNEERMEAAFQNGSLITASMLAGSTITTSTLCKKS